MTSNLNTDPNHDKELKESLKELSALLNELKITVNHVKSFSLQSNPIYDNSHLELPAHDNEDANQTSGSIESLVQDDVESFLNLNY